MKFKPIFMAASAIVLIQASPAYAACQDQVQDLRQQMQQSDLPSDRQQTFRTELDRAARAAQQNNEQECETIVSSLEEDLRAEGQSASQSAQSGQSQNQQGLTITQPQPNVRVQEGTPDITITQPAPTIRVDEQDPQVSVDVPEPEIQGQAEADVQVEESQPNVTYERTGDPTVQYESEQQASQTDPAMQQKQQDQAGTRSSTMSSGSTESGEQQQGGSSEKKVSDVTGMQLRNQQGQQFGQIDDVARDRQSGQAYVIISSGGFMGFGAEQVAVPLSEVQMQDQFAVIDVETRSQLNQYENYDSTRFEQVDDNQSLAELQQQGQQSPTQQ